MNEFRQMSSVTARGRHFRVNRTLADLSETNTTISVSILGHSVATRAQRVHQGTCGGRWTLKLILGQRPGGGDPIEVGLLLEIHFGDRNSRRKLLPTGDPCISLLYH